LVTSDQYAGPTRETAKRASKNLLNRFGGVGRTLAIAMPMDSRSTAPSCQC
jgi:hypothetical protein